MFDVGSGATLRNVFLLIVKASALSRRLGELRRGAGEICTGAPEIKRDPGAAAHAAGETSEDRVGVADLEADPEPDPMAIAQKEAEPAAVASEVDFERGPLDGLRQHLQILGC